MFGACTLIIALSAAADLLPTLSIMSAALRQSRRVISISMRARARRCSQMLYSATLRPKATRDWSRFAILALASQAKPLLRLTDQKSVVSGKGVYSMVDL